MKHFLDRTTAFFFAPRSASGFGLMRIAWGVVTLCSLLPQWIDVTRYYSSAGYLPPELEPLMLRSMTRLTLLHWFTSPATVFALYLMLLCLIVLMMLGWKTRWTTIASVLILFSFHERNPLPLSGGETVLRALGFILMVSPGIEALSLDRARQQWHHWRVKRELLPLLMMPSWPYRLLLWQFIVLYGTSLWFKFLGDMWPAGTAIAVTLHHPIFARLPLPLMDVIAPLSPLITYLTLLWHAAWLFLLVPHAILGTGAWRKLKRVLLLCGVLFHGSILLLVRAGTFSLTILTGYLGLLDEHDFAGLRRHINGTTNPRKVIVLYDGRCGLCLRSVFILELLNNLHRLHFVNFWNRSAKTAVAPRISNDQLDRALHMKQRGKFFQGFDAFRQLTWHLPALWITIPFLSLPGVAPIGRMVYARIAARRKTCDHRRCKIS